MASVNQTRPHCVNQMGKTHSKHLAARHAMCESALSVLTNSLAWDRRNAALQRKERGIIRWKAPARSCKSVTFHTWLFQHPIFRRTHSSNLRIFECLVLILCTSVWPTVLRLLPLDNELLEVIVLWTRAAGLTSREVSENVNHKR